MMIAELLRGMERAVRTRVPARWARSGARPGSPRVLVFGNCQAERVARAMAFLLPGAEVTYLSAFTVLKRFPRMADLVAEGRRYDVVFSSPFMPAFQGGGDLAAFRDALPLRLIPIIVFAAFHPDQVMVGRLRDPLGAGLVVGPLGHAHSALALFGFLEGLPTEATRRLFTGATYRRLGYLDGFDDSVVALRDLGREAGYDLDRDLARWMRRGCFMHCDNHPKIHVLADLARGLLKAEGLPYGDCDLDAYLPDDMQGAGSWPVYPEVAEHYGVSGSALFLKAATRATGPARTMTLTSFLDATYARYARTERRDLVNARVEAWREDEAVRGALREAARA